MLKFLKTNALFISMLVGIVFHNVLAQIPSITTSILLFLMLLITYCRVSPRQLKFEPLHIWLFSVQLVSCLVVYFVLLPYNKNVAAGAMICIFAPTATSAPVFAALLGGSIASLATYSIASNLSIAFSAPLLFSFLEKFGASSSDQTFLQLFLTICLKVMPLLLGPFLLANLMKSFTPKVHAQLKDRQIISFWLWVMALAILLAKATKDLLGMDESMHQKALWVALAAATVCVLQFLVGWFIGTKYDNRVAGGQGLGQKNSILAIWMAQTFFNPLVVIAPASYVLWQNLINSYQLWKYNRKKHVSET